MGKGPWRGLKDLYDRIHEAGLDMSMVLGNLSPKEFQERKLKNKIVNELSSTIANKILEEITKRHTLDEIVTISVDDIVVVFQLDYQISANKIRIKNSGDSVNVKENDVIWRINDIISKNIRSSMKTALTYNDYLYYYSIYKSIRKDFYKPLTEQNWNNLKKLNTLSRDDLSLLDRDLYEHHLYVYGDSAKTPIKIIAEIKGLDRTLDREFDDQHCRISSYYTQKRMDAWRGYSRSEDNVDTSDLDWSEYKEQDELRESFKKRREKLIKEKVYCIEDIYIRL